MIPIRVCVIGDFSANRDEGLKNIAHSIEKGLDSVSDLTLLRINLRGLHLFTDLISIRRFNPEIIHYIPGPTNASLILLRCLKTVCGGRPKVVLSAPHPMFSDKLLKIVRMIPDHVFCQSITFRQRMNNLGIQTSLLSNGVDLDKFNAVSPEMKNRLRLKYGIPEGVFVVLHVGHVASRRNLRVMANLAEEHHVVIIASQYVTKDQVLVDELRRNGCTVMEGYYREIQELYQLADCYVFPVKKQNAILTPLTVLEALACNIGVITTECEGIRTLFTPGEGLLFANRDEDFINATEHLKDHGEEISTRNKAITASWDYVIGNIVETYRSLSGVSQEK